MRLAQFRPDPLLRVRHRNKLNNDGPVTAFSDCDTGLPVALAIWPVEARFDWRCCGVAVWNPGEGTKGPWVAASGSDGRDLLHV